jgi:hypothetical protein
MTRRSAGILLAAAVLLACSRAVAGYVFFFPSGVRWPSGPIVMHLQLGPAGRGLTDGAADWGAAAESALGLWNPHIASSQFQVVRDSAAATGTRNGVNNVFFDSTIYGDRFGSNTLAVALSYRSGTRIVESDVVFNSAVSYDSYRGGLRRAIDFRRVAVHEFGHVLGLGHPDQGGQSRTSVMNSIVGNVEVPQADDIDGAHVLYGEPATTPTVPLPTGTADFPPRNESLEFRRVLETKYRDGLGRAPAASFVDLEGSVVWTQEYIRYRIGQCAHEDATARVLMQIDGLGVQPVCGPPSTPPSFPPRNESLVFRSGLEAKYRDGLRRGATSTAVDLEGDVVWTQEYLRYRLGRCSHDQAVARVLAQIDGLGTAATCG